MVLTHYIYCNSNSLLAQLEQVAGDEQVSQHSLGLIKITCIENYSNQIQFSNLPFLPLLALKTALIRASRTLKKKHHYQ